MQDSQIAFTQKDGRVFFSMVGDNNPCLKFGLCCRHYRVSFYIGEVDSQPRGCVPEVPSRRLTPFPVCMDGTEQGYGRCVALAADGRCAIYDNRPRPCREFPAYLPDGSVNPECLRLQALYWPKGA